MRKFLFIKKITTLSLVLVTSVAISLIVFKLNNHTQQILKNDNLKLEAFLKDNNRRGNGYYCKYSYVIDDSYRKIPNFQQWVHVKFENGTLLMTGSERSAIDAGNLPFKYVFDEKTKLLISKGIVRYYLANKRKVIIGEDPAMYVGPIPTPIKDMNYQLTIKFDHYPMYLDHFDVYLDATSDDGIFKIELSCKN